MSSSFCSFFAQTRATAARTALQTHFTTLERLRTSALASAAVLDSEATVDRHKVNSATLQSACASYAADALVASEVALEPIQAFARWGASYEGVYKRLAVRGRQLCSANDQLVRAYGPSVGSGAEQGEKVDHFAGPRPITGGSKSDSGGGTKGSNGNGGSLVDGSSGVARFQAPRQTIEVQGKPHQILRAVVKPLPGVTTDNLDFVNVNRNLVLTVLPSSSSSSISNNSGSCKRGARLVLSEQIYATSPARGTSSAAARQAWHFQHAIDQREHHHHQSGERHTTGGMRGPMGVDEVSYIAPLANAALCIGAVSASKTTAQTTASKDLNEELLTQRCGAPLELCNPPPAAATGDAADAEETAQGDWCGWLLTEDGALTPAVGGGSMVVGLAERPPGAMNELAAYNDDDDDGLLAPPSSLSSSSSSSALSENGNTNESSSVNAGVWASAATSMSYSLEGASLTLVTCHSPAALKFTNSNVDPRRGLLLVADSGNAAVSTTFISLKNVDF